MDRRVPDDVFTTEETKARIKELLEALVAWTEKLQR
jgi:hypothetical protein